MKKTITKLALALGITSSIATQAQTTTITFETFTLTPNSYYKDTNSVDFSSGAVTFRYSWAKSWGGWETGTAYTNLLDTVDGSYNNVYGCRPGVAYAGNNYATVQDKAVITFSNSLTQLTGFYITNITYAYKEMKDGGFSRKFGDTTGTNTGGTIAQGHYPDWFKVLVKGYSGGNLINDSIEVYLADFRPVGTANDYIVKNWQYVNCTNHFGQVDSIKFIMKSTDNNLFGMKTPGFFSIDNFTTEPFIPVGINELVSVSNAVAYPNPVNDVLNISYASSLVANMTASVYDVVGKLISFTATQSTIGANQISIQTNTLQAGVYSVRLNNGTTGKQIKFVKL